jgi:hypothetical protein
VEAEDGERHREAIGYGEIGLMTGTLLVVGLMIWEVPVLYEMKSCAQMYPKVKSAGI